MTNHLTVMVGTHIAHHNRRCIWHSAAVHECNKQTVQGKHWKLCLVQKLPVPILLFAIKKVASRLLHCTIDDIVHAEVFRTFLYLVRVRQLFLFPLYLNGAPYVNSPKICWPARCKQLFFFQRLLKTFLIKVWKINPPNIHCMLLFTRNLHQV